MWEVLQIPATEQNLILTWQLYPVLGIPQCMNSAFSCSVLNWWVRYFAFPTKFTFFLLFAGDVDLRNLSSVQFSFSALRNQFNGTLFFPPKLPVALENLWLEHNQLQAHTNFSFLHKASQLKKLSLRSNQLTGTVDLSEAPDGLSWVLLDELYFTGMFKSVCQQCERAKPDFGWVTDTQFKIL